jgi:serine/threonine protein kinase/tetratricopeptide (TPR) repeat protein
MMKQNDFPEGYQLIKWLGEGSVGHVWLAYHLKAQGHCAIKILNHIENDVRGSAERSFNREVRAMAKLSHPSLIEVYDFGRTPKGAPYVAMEHVPGVALSKYIDRSWTWTQLWTLINSLLAGLAHAHAREILHRDLKPNNILVVPFVEGLGAIKLVDFGIAVSASEIDPNQKRIEGTPAYIAPEAAQGEISAIGPWTDIYSLGVILYEILTGKLPFYGRNLLNHHQHTPPPEIKIRADVEAPSAIIPIVEKMLEKQPALRYRTVAELRDAFRLAQFEEKTTFFQKPEEEDSFYSMDGEESLSESIVENLSGPLGMGLFFLRQPPLVGRQDAQLILEESARSVLSQYKPRVVLIEAEAGLGKTRLVDWLKTEIEEWGLMKSLYLRSEPQTRGGGLKQAVLKLLGLSQVNATEGKKIIPILYPDPVSAQRIYEYLWQDDAETTKEDEDEDFGVLENAVKKSVQFLKDIAQGKPLFFWADDVHWSPEGRILKLFYQLAVENQLPFLLVATMRPTQRRTVRMAKRAILSLNHAHIIELKPIDKDFLIPSLSALTELPSGLVELACQQSQGNPLIAIESVRGYLRDQGLADMPLDPSEVLRQRIEQSTKGELGGELKSLLARATLLGRTFSVQVLMKLAEVPGDHSAPNLIADTNLILSLLETAVEDGFLKEQGQKFVFSHDLLRTEFKNHAQKLSNWAELNLATAELRYAKADQDQTGIEMEMCARNYWAGGRMQLGLELGIESLNRMLRSALMGNVTSLAKKLLQWDEELLSLSTEARGDLLLKAGWAAHQAGHYVEAEQYITQALSLAVQSNLDQLAVKASSQMAISALRIDQVDKAKIYLDQALHYLPKINEIESKIMVYDALGQWYLRLKETDKAISAFEEGLKYLGNNEALLSQQLSIKMSLAGIARRNQQIDQAKQMLTDIYEKALVESLEAIALEAKLGIALCAWKQEEVSDALHLFSEVKQSARTHLFVLEFYAALGEAWAYTMQKDWDQAQMSLMQAESLRVDIHVKNEELDQLRLSMRGYAQHHHRLDLMSQLDKLSALSVQTSTIHHG